MVYSLDNDADHVKDIEILQQGHSKKNTELKKPRNWTDPAVLKRQYTLWRSKEQSQYVYDILVEESGGPILNPCHKKQGM